MNEQTESVFRPKDENLEDALAIAYRHLQIKSCITSILVISYFNWHHIDPQAIFWSLWVGWWLMVDGANWCSCLARPPIRGTEPAQRGRRRNLSINILTAAGLAGSRQRGGRTAGQWLMLTLKYFPHVRSHYFKDIFVMFTLLQRYFHYVHITLKIFSKYIFIIFTLLQGYFPHQLIFSNFCTCNQTETFSSCSHYIGNTFHTDWYIRSGKGCEERKLN